jgi:hypothetical protein
MSKIEVDAIDKQSGSTLTLGGSGTAVTLACGATQTGFGRTGTVDWQTSSIKTATFTAVNGQGFFANTSGSAFNMNLPAGSAGNIVSVADYTNTFQTNNLTVVPNGTQKIGGIAKNAILSTEGQSVTFVYVDDTEGWKNIQDSTSNVVGSQFIEATGGTITSCGSDRIHTFTGPGTFAVSSVHPCATNNVVSYVVVGGGGGGGASWRSGGGGAGGFREDQSPVTPYVASPLDGAGAISASVASFPIVVGGGGAGGGPTKPDSGVSGSVSTFSTITSAGGGVGGGYDPSSAPFTLGTAGASGGGGGGDSNGPSAGGAGNTPPVSPSQGNAGGTGSISSPSAGGGGGGAGGAGGNGGPPTGGTGGNGVGTAINPAAGTPGPSGSLKYFSGGGTGGQYVGNAPPVPGAYGGGGNGGSEPTPGTYSGQTSGTANTGGGGGGKAGPDSAQQSGSGGSGIVIIRYKFS